ncbi:TPA: YadA-like family protein, partial [Acinetobacter baumannii]
VNGSQLHATNQDVAKNADAITAANANIKTNTTNINTNSQNINTNTHNIATNTQNITIHTNEIAGLKDADKFNVKYDDATKGKVSLGGTEGTVLSNVKAGEVSATSKDAVNGSQLHATNQDVAKNAADIKTNTQNITTNTQNITKNTTDISGLKDADKFNVKYDAADKGKVTLGGAEGTVLSNVKAGEVSATSKDAVNGSQLHATNELIKGIGDSDAMSVKYDGADKGKVTLGGAEGTVLGNVKAGEVSATSKDAVNGSQLHATNQDVAKNAADIKTNTQNITTNTQNITTNTQNITKNTTDISGLKDADKFNVKYDGADKGKVTLGGVEGTVLGNVKAGEVSATSKDAVNGSQLYATNQSIKDLSDSDAFSVKYDGLSKDKITLNGANGTLITNLKAGEVSATSTDAVNGSQLFNHNLLMANALGGGAFVNANGSLSLPSYELLNAGGTYNNVGSALQALDSAIGKVNNVANSGWTLVGKDSNGNATQSVIKPGSQVAINGDKNVNVTHSTDKDGNTSVDISLGKDINVDSVTANDIKADKVTVGGVTIDKDGINAGGKQISGVANATSDDQAVNLGQAKEMIGQSVTEATAGAVQYDKNKDGSVNKNSVSFGGTATVVQKDEKTGVDKVMEGGTTLNNVANGTQANHAVNKGQLDSNTANIVDMLGGGAAYNPSTQEFTKPNYTVGGKDYHDVGSAVDALDQANQVQDGKINNLEKAFYAQNERIETIRKDVNAGISAAMAMGNLPQPNEAGSGMISAGIASYQGQNAVAVGISATSESNQVIWKFAGTADSRSNVGGAVSVGYQWK